MTKCKEETTTTRVLRVLRAADEFLTLEQLITITTRTRNQVWAAVVHLRARHAIDVIAQLERGHAVSYWYALPPHEDTRSKIIEERAPEARSRKRRVSAGKPRQKR